MQKTANCGLPIQVVFKNQPANALVRACEHMARYSLAKMWRIMRLTILLLTVALAHAFASGTAQKVSLTGEALTMKQVFAAIEKQTGYSVFTNEQILAGTKKIAISLYEVPIRAFLDSVFKEQPINYTIDGKLIVLSRKTSLQLNKSLQAAAALIDLPPISIYVKDQEGNPLAGATITIKKSTLTRVTNEEGLALLDIAIGDVITISFVGYESQTTTIKNNNSLTLILKAKDASMNEVVVSKGYYSTTKLLNTGNVTSVKSADIERQPVSDPILALQGRVPGLTVTQSGGGVPGRMNTVRIRGRNSLINGNDPLYIVDGIHFDSRTTSVPSGSTVMSVTLGGQASPFDYLNPNDIESIEVLKDGDATAIYGSRGANGVILITSKKGKMGKTKLDLNAYTGMSKPKRHLKMMNTEQYVEMRKKAFELDGVTPTTANAPDLLLWDQHAYTDWFKELFSNQGKLTEASASVSGGTAATTFRLAGTYRTQDVMFLGDFFTKSISTGFSLNHKSANERLKMLFTTTYSNNFNSLPETGAGGSFSNYLRLAPNAPKLLHEDGSINWENGSFNNNPMASLEVKAKENSNNLISSLSMTYTMLKNLDFKTVLSYNAVNFKQTNLYPSSRISPFQNNPNLTILRRNALATNQRASWEVEPQLSYKANFLGGEVDVLVGTTFLNNQFNSLAIFASGYENDDLLKNFGGGTNIEKLYPATSNAIYRYNAFYARLGYNYKTKYVLNITGRRDGSSRFGDATKFGNFGSVGSAWIFSNENLVKQLVPFLSVGKLRASYAVTGNDQLGDYEYLDTYTSYNVPYQNVTGLIPNKLTNLYFGWERVNKLEVGLELGFFQDRINVSASYYKNRTSNQLVLYTLPEATGFRNVRANLPAILQNKGLEIVLNTVNLYANGWEWSTNFNFSLPKNKLVTFKDLEKTSYAKVYTLGMPVTTSLKYHYTGKDANNLYTFQDVNKDELINSTFDLLPVYIGGVFDGGIQNNLKFKGAELDFLWVFAKQNGIRNDITGVPGLFSSGLGNVAYQENGDYGLPFSQGTKYSLLQSLMTQSDGYVVDASYLSLKNVSLAYRFSPWGNMKLPIHAATIYVQAQNVFTLSKYKGLEPEAAQNGLASIIPIFRTITVGCRLSL